MCVCDYVCVCVMCVYIYVCVSYVYMSYVYMSYVYISYVYMSYVYMSYVYMSWVSCLCEALWSHITRHNDTPSRGLPKKEVHLTMAFEESSCFSKLKKITILEASKKERMEKSMANSPMKPAFLANSSWFTSMAAMATVAKTAPFFNGSHGALTEKCPASNGLARHPGPRSSRQGWKASRCKASWTLRGLPPPMDRIW